MIDFLYNAAEFCQIGGLCFAGAAFFFLSE